MPDNPQNWMIYVGQADKPVRFPEAYTQVTGDPMAYLARYMANDGAEITQLVKRSHGLSVGDNDQIRTKDGGLIRIVRTQ